MSREANSKRPKTWTGMGLARFSAALSFAAVVLLAMARLVEGQAITPHDPGVRGVTVDSGKPLSTLTPDQLAFFNDGMSRFAEVDSVSGGISGEDGIGLGPRFNSNSCASCHSQPAVGGTSPALHAFPFIGGNPQATVARLDGATNRLPSFITADGPVRETRFVFALNPDGSLRNKPDGGVHDLFTITGRTDAGNCTLAQPDYSHNLALGNVIFRIPTPVFGGGLIENIADETIIANMGAYSRLKQALGISGHPNRNGNDGTISRFGWKAQNKSLEIFAGEAYNVEMGVSNELFQSERPNPDEEAQGGLPSSCKLNPTPEDRTNFENGNVETPSDTVSFAVFMRFLAPPAPSTTHPGGTAAIAGGRMVFNAIGCALCHTPALKTARSSLTPALSQVSANLFSDLLVHRMGKNLADGVSQGGAGPDEFRPAPLWGLGQRVFFLHDGRTSDLLEAIKAHASPGSEANSVIRIFNTLPPDKQQELLDFLRSL